MTKKITKLGLWWEMYSYKKTFRGMFSPVKYNRRYELAEKAEKTLALFEEGKLDVSGKMAKVFADYIDTFALYKKGKMVSQLQKMTGFKAREYLRHKNKQHQWQEPEQIKTPKYMVASELRKKYQKYIELCDKRDDQGMVSRFTLNRQKKFRREAENYAEAIAKGLLTVEATDLVETQRYLATICYPLVSGAAPDVVLKDLNKKIPNQKIKEPIAKKPEAKQNRSSLKKGLKTAGLTFAIGLASYFGYKAINNAEKGSSNEPKTELKTTKQTPVVQDNATDTVELVHFEPVYSAQGQSAEKENNAKIWKSYYDNTIEILSSSKQREALYSKISKQVSAGNIVLPEDISKERLAYAYVMYQQYGVKSSLASAINSQEKLSSEAQIQLVKDVRVAGAQGLGVKQMAQKLYPKGLSSYSHYDKSSPELQKKHIQNLKEVSKIRTAHTH